MATLIASRACQLEARSLDDSFASIIDQYVENLKLPLLSDELKLLLKSYVALHYLGAGTTIGKSLYNIRFCSKDHDNVLMPSNSKVKLALLGLCNLLIPYLYRKHNWQNNLNQNLYSLVRIPWLTTDNMELLIRLLNLVTFGLFLRNGQHLLFQDKILNLTSGIDITYAAHSSAINKAQMEFMNREAIWRTIAQFTTSVVPFINLNSMKELIKKPFTTSISSVDLSTRMFQTKAAKQVCAICKNQPFNPFIIGCSHIFCYYCIQTRHQVNSTGAYNCPMCNFETQDSAQVVRYKIHNMLIKQ